MNALRSATRAGIVDAPWFRDADEFTDVLFRPSDIHGVEDAVACHKMPTLCSVIIGVRDAAAQRFILQQRS